jgi:glycosyltransferase involved in cell wall biosynthesis
MTIASDKFPAIEQQKITTERDYKIGFVMEQVAGHVTHYRNLRNIVAQDSHIIPTWNEIVYNKPGGKLEKIHEKLAFLPSYPFGITRAGLEIRSALRNSDYDVVFINSRIGSFFTHYFKGTPTVLDTDVTPLQLDNLEGYQGNPDVAPIAKLKYKLFRDFVHTTRMVLAWSEWARQSFIKDYGLPEDRVVVSPPGVNLDYWKPGNAEGSSHNQPTRILFVGGDFRRKNGPALLEWFKQQPSGSCELHIVTREQVEPMPGIKLYYDMKPNTPELLNLYQTSDMFILPSLGECFGIATIEAMACGLPVVVTDVGGTADIVSHGENGYIIPAKDMTAMNTAMQNLITNLELRVRMGKAGREIVERKFDVERNARRVVEYLKQVSA